MINEPRLSAWISYCKWQMRKPSERGYRMSTQQVHTKSSPPSLSTFSLLLSKSTQKYPCLSNWNLVSGGTLSTVLSTRASSMTFKEHWSRNMSEALASYMNLLKSAFNKTVTILAEKYVLTGGREQLMQTLIFGQDYSVIRRCIQDWCRREIHLGLHWGPLDTCE